MLFIKGTTEKGYSSNSVSLIETHFPEESYMKDIEYCICIMKKGGDLDYNYI